MAKLNARTIRHSINLCLSGQIICNPVQRNKIFHAPQQTEEKILAGVGKNIQKIRGEHPRLVNHEFLTYFGGIYPLKKDAPELPNRFKIIIEKSVVEPTKMPHSFYLKMNADIDRENSIFPTSELPAILHFRDNQNLNFSEIDRPVFRGKGDIIVNEQSYDIKAGNVILYGGGNMDEIEKVLKKYQEIMRKKNCAIIIETPGTIPTEEVKQLEIVLQNRGLNITFTRPLESDSEIAIQAIAAEENEIKDLLEDQASYLECEMKKAGEDLSFVKFGSSYLKGLNPIVEKYRKEKIDDCDIDKKRGESFGEKAKIENPSSFSEID